MLWVITESRVSPERLPSRKNVSFLGSELIHVIKGRKWKPSNAHDHHNSVSQFHSLKKRKSRWNLISVFENNCNKYFEENSVSYFFSIFWKSESNLPLKVIGKVIKCLSYARHSGSYLHDFQMVQKCVLLLSCATLGVTSETQRPWLLSWLGQREGTWSFQWRRREGTGSVVSRNLLLWIWQFMYLARFDSFRRS